MKMQLVVDGESTSISVTAENELERKMLAFGLGSNFLNKKLTANIEIAKGSSRYEVANLEIRVNKPEDDR